MKRSTRILFAAFALVWLLTWSTTSFAAINVCTETDDAVANGPYVSGDDITASLQECFDNLDDPTYADPYVPAGFYAISSTVSIPVEAGWSLRGETPAIGLTEASNATYRGQRCLLFWEGAEGGTMFNIRGKFGRFTDLIFQGEDSATGNNVDNLIEIQKGAGLSTGWLVIEDCQFWNANNYGILNGTATGEDNCEEIDLYRCTFENCGVAGFKNTGLQQMGIRLNQCRVQGTTPIFFWATGGGKAVFNQCAVLTTGVTFLRTTFVSGQFGLNNASFTINQPIIDNVAGNNFKLIDGDSYNLEVTVNGGVHSILDGEGAYTYTGEYVSVKGRSVIRFNGHRSNFNNMIGAAEAGYGTPLFVFKDCGGYARNPREQLTGDYYVRQYACYNAVTNVLYDDYPPRTVSTQSVATSGAAIAEVTGGYGNQVYGQQQPIIIDMQSVLTKYNKTIEDVTEANVTLKFRQGISDALADYDKNSTDDSEVTYAMEDVTVADGSTESHLIVRATVPYADFGSNGIRANKTYYIGCGLSITGFSGSVEPDSTTNGTVKYVTQRVD